MSQNHKVMSIRQLAELIRQANFDEAYSFATDFGEDDDASNWHGIKKTNLFNRDVALVNMWGYFNPKIIDLEYDESELFIELKGYFGLPVIDKYADTGDGIDVLLNTSPETPVLPEGQNRYDPQRQVAIVWSVEDVQAVRGDLSDDQAMQVLREVHRTHDADVGVSWETLRHWAEELFPTRMTRGDL